MHKGNVEMCDILPRAVHILLLVNNDDYYGQGIFDRRSFLEVGQGACLVIKIAPQCFHQLGTGYKRVYSNTQARSPFRNAIMVPRCVYC